MSSYLIFLFVFPFLVLQFPFIYHGILMLNMQTWHKIMNLDTNCLFLCSCKIYSIKHSFLFSLLILLSFCRLIFSLFFICVSPFKLLFSFMSSLLFCSPVSIINVVFSSIKYYFIIVFLFLWVSEFLCSCLDFSFSSSFLIFFSYRSLLVYLLLFFSVLYVPFSTLYGFFSLDYFVALSLL